MPLRPCSAVARKLRKQNPARLYQEKPCSVEWKLRKQNPARLYQEKPARSYARAGGSMQNRHGRQNEMPTSQGTRGAHDSGLAEVVTAHVRSFAVPERGEEHVLRKGR